MTGPVSHTRAPLGHTWGVSRYIRRGTAELRRDSDRIETGLIALLMVAFIGIGSLLGLTAARWADHTAVRAEQAASLNHQVRGVVLSSEPAGLKVLPGSEWPVLSAPARWTLAGRRYTGRVPVPPSTMPGQTVTIWVNGAGQPVSAPANPGDYAILTVLTVAGVEAALACLLVLVGIGGRLVIDRGRMADWDRALRTLTASPGRNDTRRWW